MGSSTVVSSSSAFRFAAKTWAPGLRQLGGRFKAYPEVPLLLTATTGLGARVIQTPACDQYVEMYESLSRAVRWVAQCRPRLRTPWTHEGAGRALWTGRRAGSRTPPVLTAQRQLHQVVRYTQQLEEARRQGHLT
jgi:hypothetical protein